MQSGLIFANDPKFLKSKNLGSKVAERICNLLNGSNVCLELKAGWSLLCTVPAPMLVVCPMSCCCRLLGSGQHNPPPGINTLVWMALWGDEGHKAGDDTQILGVGFEEAECGNIS